MAEVIDMLGECHAHVIMDGVNYKNAVALHKDGVCEEAVRKHLKAYQAAGITFVRDGGDARGASALAKELAGEYGIDYRTPLFAIHKRGHYGGIVGFPFDSRREYRELVGKAAGLNDEQIGELSRLKTGVAAVSQNNWVQPVLCNVEYFQPSGETDAIQPGYTGKGPGMLLFINLW